MCSIAKTRLQDKAAGPVNVVGRFMGGATGRELLIGAAILSIYCPDSGKVGLYWAEGLTDAGHLIGVRLTKFGGAERYDIHPEDGCSCPDATYRPREGGCKHAAALRQALPSLASDSGDDNTTPAPAATPALRPVNHFCPVCQELLEVCDGEEYCASCDHWGLAPDGSAA